jgi:hypothetical protein
MEIWLLQILEDRIFRALEALDQGDREETKHRIRPSYHTPLPCFSMTWPPLRLCLSGPTLALLPLGELRLRTHAHATASCP